MKWIIVIMTIVVTGCVLGSKLIQHNQDSVQSTPTPTPTQQLSSLDKMIEIEYQSDHYRYALITINNPSNLILYPNYEKQINSADLYTQYGCLFLINGGFYSEDNKPLGWFVSQKKEIAKARTSSLFNGYLYSQEDNVQINTTPTDIVDWGLQTGPLLFENSKPITLKLSNDKLARRMVALIDQNSQLTFIVVTNNLSLTSGPLLVDLPKILEVIVTKENISIVTAINLDGGMASAFIDEGIQIKEYQPIGSFFCLSK